MNKIFTLLAIVLLLLFAAPQKSSADTVCEEFPWIHGCGIQADNNESGSPVAITPAETPSVPNEPSDPPDCDKGGKHGKGHGRGHGGKPGHGHGDKNHEHSGPPGQDNNNGRGHGRGGR